VKYEFDSFEKSFKKAQQEIRRDSKLRFYAPAFYCVLNKPAGPREGIMAPMEREGLLSSLFVFFELVHPTDGSALSVKAPSACYRTAMPLRATNRGMVADSFRKLGLGPLLDRSDYHLHGYERR
jgi:hypothetical protein